MQQQFEPSPGRRSAHRAPMIGQLSRWVTSPPSSLAETLLLAFRWLVVACQAATIYITWPLWQVHESPPMLPALPLPAYDLGIPMLVSLALILILPVPGMTLHSALIVYAILIDQTRIQPEFVSLVFLLWGSLPNPTARAFAQAHLVSLWFFAGFHKLFSDGFLNGTAQWMLLEIPISPNPWLTQNIGYVLALTEVTLGVLAFIPRTRPLAAIMAFVVHAGILFVLLPTGHDWNEVVWPWNVALALSGFAIILPWRDSPFTALLRCRKVARPLVTLLLIAPMGFYIGVTDAYLAHHLYSSNTAVAHSTALSIDATWNAFNVPLPPEHRLFKQYFRATCQPGDQLTIVDQRWWYQERGLGYQEIMCPVTSG